MRKLSADDIEELVRQARELKLGQGGFADIAKFYSELPLAFRLAMFFTAGGPVDPVPADSRLELEEMQLHAFMRMNAQHRAELIRRAEAFLELTFKVDVATLEPSKPAQPGASELAPLPAGMMLPCDSTSLADALRLFRAFVIRNATQWVFGSNHHPIWEMLTTHIDGPEPHSGPEYEFIYPTNRQRLSVLKKLAEDKADE